MKTANKCYLANAADAAEQRRWYVVDAKDQVLGRLAVRIATVLMGKHKPIYTPHVDCGDFVIVLNAGDVKLTGKKDEGIVYQRYSGYPGGQKVVPIKRMLERHPERVLYEAVRRMLPKNRLARRMLRKLKLYTGETHSHQAQNPEPLPL
ncbi:MAG: 50S ribosomal protein L13 [Planctomycetes bacterium]|nr:50S ribosomal protein L13 [Planctomycetota bacterium]